QTFDADNRELQGALRELHRQKVEHPLLPYTKAVQKRFSIDWSADQVSTPSFTGARVLQDVQVDDLVPFIDWTFFFAAWELKGKYPKIFEHPDYGPAARELHDNAVAMLRRMQDEGRLTARGVYGFWPANSDGDDIVVWTDASRTEERCRFPMLRQQRTSDDTKPTLCLADFVAPIDSGLADHVGAFAVSAFGAEDFAAEFEVEHDDYNAILVKALADRCAEAFAEKLHQQARADWGFPDAADKAADSEYLVREQYRSIRPAFGYPACPDHTEKETLFEVLGARDLGIGLTEHFAMTPAASVSGIYLGHEATRYFSVGRIDRAQVEDYAKRKGMPTKDAERWLAPNLAYDPAD
ncbi:MAG: vitamin B12 dependent-methionine synthase activation domain-containing protein, partial [Planctomycetota bacterium]